MLAVQQRLEATELILAEREREVANAQEKITSLSDDLIASQGKVRRICVCVTQIQLVRIQHRQETEFLRSTGKFLQRL